MNRTSERADMLAQGIALEPGDSGTDVVIEARDSQQERIEQDGRTTSAARLQRLREIAERARAIPLDMTLSEEEILGYDAMEGMP